MCLHYYLTEKNKHLGLKNWIDWKYLFTLNKYDKIILFDGIDEFIYDLLKLWHICSIIQIFLLGYKANPKIYKKKPLSPEEICQNGFWLIVSILFLKTEYFQILTMMCIEYYFHIFIFMYSFFLFKDSSDPISYSFTFSFLYLFFFQKGLILKKIKTF